jgi:hypothetical protein
MATTFRALVMIVVLVGLPAAWVCYGPLPPEAQRVADRLVGGARELIGWDKTSPSAVVDSPVGADSPAWNSGDAPRTGATPQAFPAAPVQSPALITPTAPTFAERVEPLLAQLRQLGAVAYDLQPWGTSGKLYRFHCEMPLAASAQLTQQFEAVAEDPQLSVEQVVAQVAQWRGAQERAEM